jgi:hypothetical protein
LACAMTSEVGSSMFEEKVMMMAGRSNESLNTFLIYHGCDQNAW